MPLLRFDVVEGRAPAALRTILDAAHRAMVSAFRVPQTDRYQIVHQHPAHEMIIEDTGLGMVRTADQIVVQVVTRPRGQDMKQAFYEVLCREFQDSCGIAPSDVVVTMVTVGDEDWSFGNGRAQFLTGEL